MNPDYSESQTPSCKSLILVLRELQTTNYLYHNSSQHVWNLADGEQCGCWAELLLPYFAGCVMQLHFCFFVFQITVYSRLFLEIHTFVSVRVCLPDLKLHCPLMLAWCCKPLTVLHQICAALCSLRQQVSYIITWRKRTIRRSAEGKVKNRKHVQ